MLSGLRVLVVEDESIFATELTQVINEAEGEVVGPLSSATQAPALLKAGDIDLAVLDAELSDGEVTPLVEALYARGVPFVLCSGQEIPRRIADRHPDLRALRKPVDATRVVAELRRARRAAAAAA